MIDNTEKKDTSITYVEDIKNIDSNPIKDAAIVEVGSEKDFKSDLPLQDALAASEEKVPIFESRDRIPESLKSLSREDLEILDKKTTRKMDLRILIMVCWIYICNYLDRTNIASARLGGLEDDLKLTSTQYQTAISVLFVGYITMQIPFNIVLNRLGKPSLFISVIMTVWGIISTATGGVQSYGGLIAVRVLLGFVESGFFGCCLYYLSCWYTKRELGLRNSILYSGSLISGAFSALISMGIIKGMDGVKGLRAWRWCFIIEGAITVATVPLAYFILPDNPSNTKFLSQQEKDLVMWKLRMDVSDSDDDKEVLGEGQDGHNSFRFALRLAMGDIKVWLLTGCFSFLVAACGVTNFFPSVVKTLEFDKMVTLCLTAPPYCIAVVTTFIWSWHSDRTGERFWHIVAPLILAFISFIIAVSSLNTVARYIAMCLMPTGLYCPFILIISCMSICVPRPPLKRAIALSLMNCLANSTSIWNAYLYPEDNAPRYAIAMACNCAFIGIAVLFIFLLRLYLARLNKKIANGTMNWFNEFGNDGSHVKPDFRFTI